MPRNYLENNLNKLKDGDHPACTVQDAQNGYKIGQDDLLDDLEDDQKYKIKCHDGHQNYQND